MTKVNAVTYSNITGALNKTGNAAWYSFENKQNRDIKVMIKNLHHSYSPQDIIMDISQRYKLAVKNATNKRKWLSAEQKKERRSNGQPEEIPLDMFIVSFDKTTEINKIHDIRTICNCRVKVEALKKNRILPQCKSCQEYGQSQNFAAGQHAASNVQEDTNPKRVISWTRYNRPATIAKMHIQSTTEDVRSLRRSLNQKRKKQENKTTADPVKTYRVLTAT